MSEPTFEEPNPWQTTTPDNLPWGETVRVRFLDTGECYPLQPITQQEVAYWYDRDAERQFSLYRTQGTEWRPINERMDKDGG